MPHESSDDSSNQPNMACPLTPCWPASLPLDPLGPCRPTPWPPGTRLGRHTPWPPRTLKGYLLTPWEPFGLPLDPLGSWIGIKDHLADLSRPICLCLIWWMKARVSRKIHFLWRATFLRLKLPESFRLWRERQKNCNQSMFLSESNFEEKLAKMVFSAVVVPPTLKLFKFDC